MLFHCFSKALEYVTAKKVFLIKRSLVVNIKEKCEYIGCARKAVRKSNHSWHWNKHSWLCISPLKRASNFSLNLSFYAGV